MQSVIDGDRKDMCFLCGRYGPTEEHHMLHGPRRKKAELYGLKVHLCHRCHERLHRLHEYDKDLEEMAQIVFEREHGHEKYMEEFGKNFRR